MPANILNYKVFIATPGGLEKEREAFRDTLLEYTLTEASHRGAHFTPVGWEITIGGIQRPQHLINRELRQCDYTVVVLHDRWGQSPFPNADGPYTSGTEEEFEVAKECLRKYPVYPMRDIVLFFKALEPRRLTDVGPQLEKVLAFRKEREYRKDLLYYTYDSIDYFKTLVRRTLAAWLRSHEDISAKKASVSLPARNIETDVRSPLATVLGGTHPPAATLQDAEQLAQDGKWVEAELLYSRLIVGADNVRALISYSRALRKRGQLTQAKEMAGEAIEAAKLQRDHDLKAEATRQLGRIEDQVGNLIAATALLRNSAIEFEMVDNVRGLASALRNLGQVLRKRGKLDEAIYELGRAAELSRSAGDSEGAAESMGFLGLIRRARGELAEARKCHAEALELHTKSGNKAGVAIVSGNLGNVLRMLEDYDAALKMHDDALSYFQAAGDKKAVARELSNIGTVHRLRRDYEKARHFHDESLRISREVGSKYGEAMQLSCVGQIEEALGSWEPAEEKFMQSLAISAAIDDKQGCIIQFQNLGRVWRHKGDDLKAEEFFKKALQACSEMENAFLRAQAQLALADFYVSIGRFGEAKPILFDAKRVFDELQFRKESQQAFDLISRCN
jgi:tetratricopeptide (TPR) repeat protein